MMVVVCTSKSGVIFSSRNGARAEYGQMFRAKMHLENITRTPSMVYQVYTDTDTDDCCFVRLRVYWRPAKNLEIDLFHTGVRFLNKITKF